MEREVCKETPDHALQILGKRVSAGPLQAKCLLGCYWSSQLLESFKQLLGSNRGPGPVLGAGVTKSKAAPFLIQGAGTLGNEGGEIKTYLAN